MTRRLHDTDAEAFAVFSAAVPEQELDEAFVQIDHWLVFGTFIPRSPRVHRKHVSMARHSPRRPRCRNTSGVPRQRCGEGYRASPGSLPRCSEATSRSIAARWTTSLPLHSPALPG